MHMTHLRLALAMGAATLAALPAYAQLDDVLQGRSLVGQAVKGVAIGYAVRQSSKQLNSFINTVTLRNHVPQRLATKVVPVLSVGERGYVGGAQVVGPRSLVDRVQVVWQYENEFQRAEYRVKALVPSSSLNPLKLQRVERVGLGALIDVSLPGSIPPGNTRAGSIGVGRVLRAAVVAGAVVLAAKPLNSFINTITFNKDKMTRVVPQASFGERGYIGGSQVTGASSTIGSVKAVFEYWDMFDRGRYRIRALVPVNGVDPTKIRRVEGAGVVALIDTSIAAQERANRMRGSRAVWRDFNPWAVPGERPRVVETIRVVRPAPRKDNGLHLGWEIGKHRGWDKGAPGARVPAPGGPPAVRIQIPGVPPPSRDERKEEGRGPRPRDDRKEEARDRKPDEGDRGPSRDEGNRGRGRGRGRGD